MSDIPADREPTERELADRLAGLEPPAHRPDFWAALDARIELVTVLQTVEVPEHHDGFWAAFDAALRAEPERELETAEVVSLRSTVFDEAVPAVKRARRRGPRQWSRRRLEHLVQLSAAAAIVALLAGALAWWGTRGDTEGFVAGPARTTITTTTIGGPPTSAPAAPLYSGASHVEDTPAPLGRGSVPVGASPDGKFLYVARPAQSNERCSFSQSSGLSTAAKWLYAEPVDGLTPGHRILTSFTFADPKMALGPNDKVVVSDSCNGPATHLIATAESNGAVTFDQTVPRPPTTQFAVDGAAWSASGTGLYLRGEGASGWYRYDFVNGLSAAPEISPAARVVAPLANGEIVSVGRPAGTATWTVSIGNKEVVALTAPTHGDYARAVRVDAGHNQLAIAGKDRLLVLTARPDRVVDVGSFQYAAEAVTWAADGNGLVAAPLKGGLEYLTFAAPSANALPASVSLGFEGVAYSVLSVPTSSSLVIRQGVAEGEAIVAGEAFILKLTN
ncbi:MAG: hypothetical protein ABI658_11320 [Acidimicrobiales bacterium]